MTETAIITGASRGIGRAIAEEFAPHYNVTLISRHYNEVREVAQELGGGHFYLPVECDVGNEEEVVKAFSDIYEKCGSIDILVNNAGINSRTTLEDDFEQGLEGFDEEIRVNLRGVYICSCVAAEYMAEQKHGSIINISSIKGKEPTSSPGYGASKAGVIKLTRDFARALAPHNIRVNCVAPGFINTGLTTELPKEKKESYKSEIPMGRFGEVEEVARIVSFLTSEEASYITGATLDVNGGYLMD